MLHSDTILVIMYYIYVYLDCASQNAELAIVRGEEKCIIVSPTEQPVNILTKNVTSCTDEYGGSASLISLPANETRLWGYIISLIDT